jgi:hypothetical protein
MIEDQDTNRTDRAEWLELANGGGVMLRDPTAIATFGGRGMRRRANRGLLCARSPSALTASPAPEGPRCADE